MLVEALVFMSWRAAVGGEAIPQTMGETASAVYDRLAATFIKEENCVTPMTDKVRVIFPWRAYEAAIYLPQWRARRSDCPP